MDYLRKHLRQIISTVILVVAIVAALLVFMSNNAARIVTQDEEYVAELASQRAVSVDSLISENLTFIRSTAYLYGETLTSEFADVAAIRDYESNTVFDRLIFIDKSGDDYTSKGVQANLSDRDYYQAGMRGESGTTYVLASRVTGERQIGFYAPVRYEGRIVGVMVGWYGEDYIGKLLEYTLFGCAGEGWLITRDGVVLGSSLEDDPENYYDFMGQAGKCDAKQLRATFSGLAAGEGTSFSYTESGGQVSAHAVALSQTDWILIRNFPQGAANQIIGNANREGVQLVAALLVFFILYGAVVGIGFVLDMRRTREANRNANDISKGVETLFETFMTVDLDANEYRYIGAAESPIGLPGEGPYDVFVDTLASKVPEKDSRPAIIEALSAANLREALSDTDLLSIQVHAPAGDIEWLTYNVIVIERAEDATPTRLLVVRQDVTEFKHREQAEQEKLQDALDEAEHASNAKTEFLFNMSHDLRTPMNAIIGYTELAQREGVTEDEMRDFIGKIDASSVHLLALINDILEMSRIESGKITLVYDTANLVRIAQEAHEMFMTQMSQKNIEFVLDTSRVADPWVSSDEARLNRILLNLISNAYKFTPEGGQVSIVVEQEGRDGDVGRYVLRVKDTGIGMSDEFVGKLFSPFERERTSTVSKTQGTGLGLSITKRIVDLMGGSIEVKTEQGKGTEFIVRVSMEIVEGKDDASASDDADAAPSFEGTHLLVVEDNAINLEIASMILEQSGFTFDTAVNGQEAVDKVQAAPAGTYDAVLMDVQMPVMDGYAATRAIRALDDAARASVPIVAMTANAFAEDVAAAHEAGMDGHIAKPIDIEKMLATLADVLNR